MTIGPAPMTRIEEMSVRLGIKYFSRRHRRRLEVCPRDNRRVRTTTLRAARRKRGLLALIVRLAHAALGETARLNPTPRTSRKQSTPRHSRSDLQKSVLQPRNRLSQLLRPKAD